MTQTTQASTAQTVYDRQRENYQRAIVENRLESPIPATPAPTTANLTHKPYVEAVRPNFAYCSPIARVVDWHFVALPLPYSGLTFAALATCPCSYRWVTRKQTRNAVQL